MTLKVKIFLAAPLNRILFVLKTHFRIFLYYSLCFRDSFCFYLVCYHRTLTSTKVTAFYSKVSFFIFSEHKEKFQQKRKLHYNEFQAVKLAQQLMADDDDDDDDDSNKQNSVQMVTDQSVSADNSNMDSSSPRRLSETTMDSSGHLETQIN